MLRAPTVDDGRGRHLEERSIREEQEAGRPLTLSQWPWFLELVMPPG
jgi:hypothetical protein